MLQGASKIVCRSSQGVIKERQRLMIIELENYNSAKELSTEDRKTESLGLVRNRDTGPDGKRTKAAVCMEGKRVATRMRTGPHIQGLQSGTIWGLSTTVLWSRRGISKRKIANRKGKQGLEPSKPR